MALTSAMRLNAAIQMSFIRLSNRDTIAATMSTEARLGQAGSLFTGNDDPENDYFGVGAGGTTGGGLHRHIRVRCRCGARGGGRAPRLLIPILVPFETIWNK